MNFSHAHVRKSHNISCKALDKYNTNLQNAMQKSVSPEHNVKVCGKTTGDADDTCKYVKYTCLYVKKMIASHMYMRNKNLSM